MISEAFLQILLSGILTGAVYGLIGIGFTLVFGVMKIVNFAHGHLVLVAMFASYVLVSMMGWDLYATLLIVIPGMFIFGIMIHRLVIRRLVGAHEFQQMLATIAVMIILENCMNLGFGGDMRGINTPLTTQSFSIGGAIVPVAQAYAALGSFVTVILLGTFLKSSFFGNALRASADNLTGSYVVGIPVKHVYTIAFALSATLAGIAGVLMLPFSLVSPFAGNDFIIKAFVTTIIGGLGSVPGAFAGGILVGIVEAFSTLAGGGSFGTPIVFGILILTLMLRPAGLFSGRVG